MSFYATIEQYKNKSKCVTRRQGWPFLKKGDHFMGVEKGQGLKKGQKINRIGPSITISERWELIRRLTDDPVYGREEMIKEGFPDMKPADFVVMYCKMNKCTPDDLCHRIEFSQQF